MTFPRSIAASVRRPALEPGGLRADLCVIGAGSGGLTVAAGAVQMGASVVLIEKGDMGGDCLNRGCVPSKALIAASQMAVQPRRCAEFGVRFNGPEVNFADVFAHVHRVIGAIAPHDSVERFESLGVQVIKARASFIAPDAVQAGDTRIRARRFVIATGSRPMIPPLPGLGSVDYLTNETIFELEHRPGHLIVIGGGPIGVELAQAQRRLGAQVTLIARHGILTRDEPEAVDVVRLALSADGIQLIEGRGVAGVSATESGVAVRLNPADPDAAPVHGSHLLVATGRIANADGLGLELAGIAADEKGIAVDSRLRTSNRRVFAIGDAINGPRFTHVAGYQAGIVIRNALFGLPAGANYAALPWVTFTDPELAHVGLTEAEARARKHRVSILTMPFASNDRAQTERATEGLAKIVVGSRGRILGATIVGRHAGELIGLWALAISSELRIGALANVVLPYPTLSELSKRVAGSFFSPTLFGPMTRSIVRLVQRILP